MSKNAEITTTNNAGYLALKNLSLTDMVAEEMPGLSFSFERIKIPSGGGTVFEIPGDDPDEPETVNGFSAVILHQHPLSAYCKEEYRGGSNPPDCGGCDGVCGTGNPSGNCKSIPTTLSAPARTARKHARTADACICSVG